MKGGIRQLRVCPLCGEAYGEPPAISRTDNETPICPDCGSRQALEAIGVSEAEREDYFHHQQGEADTNMNFPDRKTVERLREQFPVGCRIVLDCMDDPYVSIPPGTQGICRGVDDAGSVMAAWDCGSSLAVAYGADRAHRVASEEEIRVSLNWLGKQQKTAGHCPRCGKPLDSFERHSLSRRANITVCDECGLREALEDAGMIPRLPLSEWWCVQNNWVV